jgi:hypothetical protein
MSMVSIEQLLARLEIHLQALFEGKATHQLPGGRNRRELDRWLAEVMRAACRQTQDGRWQAPDLYIITLPIVEGDIVDQGLLLELAHSLESDARRQGYTITNPPVVRIVADPNVNPPRLQVLFSDGDISQTVALEVDIRDPVSAQATQVSGAFLIVDGLQTYPLINQVIAIGRDPGNQLVLDDPRVSRTHAQLRVVQGQYVIFDLQSTGGTMVNGRFIQQQGLIPGDVISLAGLPLVYGVENSAEVESTQKLPPESLTPETR